MTPSELKARIEEICRNWLADPSWKEDALLSLTLAYGQQRADSVVAALRTEYRHDYHGDIDYMGGNMMNAARAAAKPDEPK